MYMSVNVYNIIWADDECDTLKKDTNIRKLFDNKRIEVLCHVPTSEELKDAIERYKDRIDAIIVDGNFTKDKVEYVEPTDISGLIHTISFIELFNSKRDIPFFLYTGRKVMLQEICKNGELDYFLNNNRIIQKGNIDELAYKIIKDVDHIHSVEFLVKKKYQSLINIAKEVDEQCAVNLHQFLLDEARDKKFDKSVDLFNNLRDILEKIQDLCKQNLIIPYEVNSLNDFKYFWGKYGLKRDDKTFKPKEGVLPKPIALTISQLIDITQDGSHKKQDLNLHVSEYATETKSPFLFRACLYLVMDILRWYKDTNDKLVNGELRTPLFYHN